MDPSRRIARDLKACIVVGSISRPAVETQRRLPVALQSPPSAVLTSFAFYPLLPVIMFR